MLKHRGTYEIMHPQDVGIAETSLVLGKHSGRHALRERLRKLGHTPDDATLDDIFARFKALADQRRDIHDDDLQALALGQDPDTTGPWSLLQLNASSQLGGGSSTAVTLVHEDGREVAETGAGDGPVEAVLRAITRATGTELALTQFQISAMGEGGDAQGRAELTARHGSLDWHGNGVSTDIVEAAALAALAIVNRIERQAPARTRSAPKALESTP
jgi:2-isopropylmalate synthase